MPLEHKETFRAARLAFEEYAAMGAPALPSDRVARAQVAIARADVRTIGGTRGLPLIALSVIGEMALLRTYVDRPAADRDQQMSNVLFALALAATLERLDLGVLLRAAVERSDDEGASLGAVGRWMRALAMAGRLANVAVWCEERGGKAIPIPYPRDSERRDVCAIIVGVLYWLRLACNDADGSVLLSILETRAAADAGPAWPGREQDG